VLFACSSGVIGACHAGWKGALAGIVENTVNAMVALGASKDTIRAAVGPCIAQESYEVSQDYRDNFLNQSPENDRFFKELPSKKYLFDIRGYVHHRLEMAGAQQISHVAHDTCQDEAHFFSNRRKTLRNESSFGGQISLIAMV
jgi:YfiH family protein